MLVRMPIEVDITYVNKTWFTLKKKVNPNVKHYVIGFFQREGQAILTALPDNNTETIEQAVLKCTEKGSILYCEENTLPASIKELYEVHELKPSDGYVKGDVHVNNVKNMWRDLKRVIKRTHVHVSTQHLQLYCSEVFWRVNTRHLSASEKFELALSFAAKPIRMTYDDLKNKKSKSIAVGTKECAGEDFVE